MFAVYGIGLCVAPLVAWLLKVPLLRVETPMFVMEMPMYKVPSLRIVLRRMTDSGWAFLRRAGTLILASMVLVWGLLYFPDRNAAGQRYEELIAVKAADADALKNQVKELPAEEEPKRNGLQEQIAALETQIHGLESEWKSNSLLGRLGHGIEPAVRPLGWDWKIGTAVLASFPAREVVVGTLGIIYHEGRVDTEEIRAAVNAGDTPLASSRARRRLKTNQTARFSRFRRLSR